jgi:hypothetical protein
MWSFSSKILLEKDSGDIKDAEERKKVKIGTSRPFVHLI